jgi:hypothetical protein
MKVKPANFNTAIQQPVCFTILNLVSYVSVKRKRTFLVEYEWGVYRLGQANALNGIRQNTYAWEKTTGRKFILENYMEHK